VAVSKTRNTPRPIPEEFLRFIAGQFKVLAEPMRLRILHALQPGELTVTQLVEATGASQANVSKHLGVLTRSEMVGRRKEGLNVFYSIADPVIFELCELVCNKMGNVTAGRVRKAAGKS
jgi:DNA-binding transcriptional ArsR family regulator